LELFSLAGVFYFSTLVFALCALLMLGVRLPVRGARTSTTFFLRELAAGVRFVVASPPLRRIFAITIVFNIWGFPFTSMIPVIGSANLGLNPFMVGVLSSTEGLGAFLGAVVIALLARPWMFFSIYLWGTTLYLCMVGYLGVLSFIAGGPVHSFLASSATLVVLGMASACFATMQGTLTYLAAAPEYRSRVLGVLTLCIGTGPIGFFNIGWMAESFGVSAALMISSVEGLLALLFLWAFSRDAQPDPVRA
ncbi:MAG: MFS transporter, partial [Pseudomonadota bacterium]